jgi:hypothetical protein
MHGRLMVVSAILFAAIGTADAADRPGAPGGASSVVSEDFLRKERARDATTPQDLRRPRGRARE